MRRPATRRQTTALALALAGTIVASMGCATESVGAPGSANETVGAPGSANGDTHAVACVQKSSRPDGSDPDRVAKGLPRKLDCDATTKPQAIAEGCVEEEPGDMDVCCPTSVVGARPAPGGSSAPAEHMAPPVAGSSAL